MPARAALTVPADTSDATSITGATAGLDGLDLSFSTGWVIFNDGVALTGTLSLDTLTVAGTLVLAGGPGSLSEGASITTGGATLTAGAIVAQGSAATLTVAGTLALGGEASAVQGGSITAGAVLLAGGGLDCDAASAIVVGSGATSALPGTLDVTAGATLSGYGQLSGPVQDDGLILATNGALGLFGSLAGSGTLGVGPLGTLFVVSAVGAGLAVAFQGGAGTLELFGEAPAFAATITGFVAGDAIDLSGVSLTGAAWATGQLTLTAADGTRIALALAGAYAGQGWVPLPDGLGGTEVLLAGAVVPLPAGANVTLAGGLQLVGGGNVSGQLAIAGTVALAAAITAGTLATSGTLVVLAGGGLSAGAAALGGLVLLDGTATLAAAGTTTLTGTLQLSGGAVASLGSLTLSGGAVTVDAASALAVGGAAVETGLLSVASGIVVVGAGRLVANFDISGQIRSTAGVLALVGSLGGRGTVRAGTGGTLALLGPVSLRVIFTANAVVQIANAAGFSGSLNSFAPGDTLDMANMTVSSVQWSSGTLTLFNGAQTAASLAMPGSYGGQTWQALPDGGAGTLIQLAPGGTASPLSVTGAVTLASATAVPSAIVQAGGTLTLAGGALDAASVEVAAGGTLMGAGTVYGAVTIDGTVLASGGALLLSSAAAVGGAGTALIGAGATLFAPLGLDLPVEFLGDGGTLALLGTASDAQTISGLSATDAIDLAGASVAQASYSLASPGLGTLALSDAAGDSLGTLTLAGEFGTHGFLVRPDGSGGSLIALVPCFTAGTRIATPVGERPVERLGVGDVVLTPAGPRRLRWVARRLCDSSAAPELRPVRIAAGALGAGQPCRPLLLSPRHALLLGGALVPAVALVDLPGIARAPPGLVAYHHLALDTHATVLAEGIAAETFLPTGPAVAFDAEAGARPEAGAPCAPELAGGAPLEALRRHLAAAPGPLTPPGPLRGHVERIAQAGGRTRLEGWALDSANPRRPVALLALRAGAACGCAVANEWRPDLDRAGLAGGRCGFRLDLPGEAAVVLVRQADGEVLPVAD